MKTNILDCLVRLCEDEQLRLHMSLKVSERDEAAALVSGEVLYSVCG